ncbi:phage DNA packaging protein J [Rhizobium sp. NZLR1b]|nr:phage DNA packaging protein J [Rhizobium sp. NZLR8]MBX5164919.1 phage DNA packaging protein J [Rhizobium sp. NZLR4b]MBX5170054.1 phage DNA packaging protein J [Rhizobium sp. NZLR1b]MBX5184861.1 phage DNA packaging protein J [Rhizobium sp. NZLR5]MBX5193006.1 phage DNA packaging protein J [Rhizobium sp. NZLR3b]MBX5209734.1 phage DNA packaging protein J [Rhizobium sp. NZLR11]
MAPVGPVGHDAFGQRPGPPTPIRGTQCGRRSCR